MSEKVEVGDLVWAKMTGFSHWPGKIISPGKDVEIKRPRTTKPMHCVWFFGSNDYAWIGESRIEHYQEFKETFSKRCKTAQFRAACAQIEEHAGKQREALGVPEDDLQGELDVDEASGDSLPTTETTTFLREEILEGNNGVEMKIPGPVGRKKIQAASADETLGLKKPRLATAGHFQEERKTVKQQEGVRRMVSSQASTYSSEQPRSSGMESTFSLLGPSASQSQDPLQERAGLDVNLLGRMGIEERRREKEYYRDAFQAINVLGEICLKIPLEEVRGCLRPLKDIHKCFVRNHGKLIFPQEYTTVRTFVEDSMKIQTFKSEPSCTNYY